MKEINNAFKKAIEAYFRGKEPEKLKKSMKGRMKYAKKDMERIEEARLGSKFKPDVWGLHDDE